MVFGLIGGTWLAKTLSALLFGVQPLDLVVFTLVPLVVFVSAAAGCVMPAYHAANIDPLEAFRP